MIDEAHDEALEIRAQATVASSTSSRECWSSARRLERDEVETFLSDIPKRPQRDLSVHGAGLAVSRRAIHQQPAEYPGTIRQKAVG